MTDEYHIYQVEGFSDDGCPISRRYVSYPPEKDGGFLAIQSAREQGIHPTKCIDLGPKGNGVKARLVQE
jgi:hypothetical protein